MPFKAHHQLSLILAPVGMTKEKAHHKLSLVLGTNDNPQKLLHIRYKNRFQVRCHSIKGQAQLLRTWNDFGARYVVAV
jgi:hypothetical protein